MLQETKIARSNTYLVSNLRELQSKKTVKEKCDALTACMAC